MDLLPATLRDVFPLMTNKDLTLHCVTFQILISYFYRYYACTANSSMLISINWRRYADKLRRNFKEDVLTKIFKFLCLYEMSNSLYLYLSCSSEG